MKLTVEDVCNFPEFPDLRVIAGKGGLNNVIDRCGILDYEFVDGIKEKWYNTNFHEENMIVVTSFLYAKDNDYLIFDAIKSLAARKCSGIIIKNIFRLPISDTAVSYTHRDVYKRQAGDCTGRSGSGHCAGSERQPRQYSRRRAHIG